MIKQITSYELKNKMADGTKMRVIDCRQPFERNESYIPNTEFIPMNELPQHIDDLKNEEMIIFTCRTGNRSQYVCEWFESQGLHNTANHAGGIYDWMMNGFEVQR